MSAHYFLIRNLLLLFYIIYYNFIIYDFSLKTALSYVSTSISYHCLGQKEKYRLFNMQPQNILLPNAKGIQTKCDMQYIHTVDVIIVSYNTKLLIRFHVCHLYTHMRTDQLRTRIVRKILKNFLKN